MFSWRLDLGVGIPIDGRPRRSFDRSLTLTETMEAVAGDALGEYSSLALANADDNGSMVHQEIKAYQEISTAASEMIALKRLLGTAFGDNFFKTTFNSPVVRLR